MTKHLWYAIAAACLGMALTSGVVAYAVAAPDDTQRKSSVNAAVEEQLDVAIARQLATVKRKLGRT